MVSGEWPRLPAVPELRAELLELHHLLLLLLGHALEQRTLLPPRLVRVRVRGEGRG